MGLGLLSYLLLILFMMNIVCWNARGAGCTQFSTNVQNLIHNHRMKMLFVHKPRISGSKALFVVKSLGYSCYEIVDAVGFSGGLWLLWDDKKGQIDLIGTSDQSISVCVQSYGKAS